VGYWEVWEDGGEILITPLNKSILNEVQDLKWVQDQKVSLSSPINRTNTLMLEIDELKRVDVMVTETKKTNIQSTNSPNISSQNDDKITSRVAGWLINLVYPLADKIIFPFFFKDIRIEGKENVPKTGAVIIAPTHRSRWDALIVPYATGKMVTGRNPRFMVSANEMKGIQGWFIRRLGGFPVDTERPSLDSLYHSADLLSQGEMVVIFPEGNIYRIGDMVHSLKRGVAKIALEIEASNPEVEVKILPVAIQYSEPIPSRGCSVKVKIGSPLTVNNYLDGSIRENSIRLTADLKVSLEKELAS